LKNKLKYHTVKLLDMNSKCIDNESTREDAIDHVVESANYWSSDNIHSDSSFNCPSNIEREKAFKTAVEHVKYHHYKLSKEDIEEAKRKFFG